MQAKDTLTDLVSRKATDVFCIAGRPLSYKLDGSFVMLDDVRMMPDDTLEFITQIYQLAGRSMNRLLDAGDDDFSFAINGVSRFRANTYRQRGSLATVIRIVPFELPRASDMNIPEEVERLAELRHGLVLVSGPAGSGKSTTLATIIERINTTRNGHIVTLENPIEFLHRHQMSIVSQREIQIDTEDYSSALRAAMRQSPNVILIGELRDLETTAVALAAAETGHLVLSTVHTLGAANTVERLLSAFDQSQLEQARMQLSMVLECVVSQQLVRTVEGGIVPVFEIMYCTAAVRNLIRDGRTYQLAQIIDTSAEDGMVSMDANLFRLYSEGAISAATMLNQAIVPDTLARMAGISQGAGASEG